MSALAPCELCRAVTGMRTLRPGAAKIAEEAEAGERGSNI